MFEESGGVGLAKDVVGGKPKASLPETGGGKHVEPNREKEKCL